MCTECTPLYFILLHCEYLESLKVILAALHWIVHAATVDLYVQCEMIQRLSSAAIAVALVLGS